MIYLENFQFPDEERETDFFYRPDDARLKRTCYDTYYPFQMLGAPDKRYGEFSFTPQSLPGFDTNPLHKDKTCYGVDLREYPFEGGLSLRFLLDFYEKADDKQAFFFSRPQWFDLLAGTKELRFQIIRGLSEEEIRASWQPELEQYKAKRKKYLLYPDYGK